MCAKIEKRDDVSPKEGLHKYGDVEFADPVNKKYPIDSEQHVRSAWSYINHPNNAHEYDKQDLIRIRQRIIDAAKTYDVDISEKADDVS